MKNNSFLTKFFKLKNEHHRNSEKEDLTEERELVQEYCNLDEERKVEILVLILQEINSVKLTVLTTDQQREIELYNQKSLIDLKNMLVRMLMYGLLIMIAIMYIIPFALDGTLIKPFAEFISGIFSLFNP